MSCAIGLPRHGCGGCDRPGPNRGDPQHKQAREEAAQELRQALDAAVVRGHRTRGREDGTKYGDTGTCTHSHGHKHITPTRNNITTALTHFLKY